MYYYSTKYANDFMWFNSKRSPWSGIVPGGVHDQGTGERSSRDTESPLIGDEREDTTGRRFPVTHDMPGHLLEYGSAQYDEKIQGGQGRAGDGERKRLFNLRIQNVPRGVGECVQPA